MLRLLKGVYNEIGQQAGADAGTKTSRNDPLNRSPYSAFKAHDSMKSHKKMMTLLFLKETVK